MTDDSPVTPEEVEREQRDEAALDIGETAEALDRLLGGVTSAEAERAPGGVPNSPELPTGNGKGENQPPSPQADPQPEEERELVPVGEKAAGPQHGGCQPVEEAVEFEAGADIEEANYPDQVRPDDNLTGKAKNGTAQYPKDGPSAQESGLVGCAQCGGECQGHDETLEGGRLAGGGGDAGPEAVGQDHPGELVALEPPLWGTVELAGDGMVAGGPPPPPEEEPPAKGLATIYDYTDEDLIKMGTDKLLELAGITTVDLTDAKDYELIRGAKLVAIEKLQHALANTNTQDLELLAKLSQKMGQLEKAKMEVIQLKLGGKPGDRTKPGTTLRARIGIATTGADGKSVVELEVEGKG